MGSIQTENLTQTRRYKRVIDRSNTQEQESQLPSGGMAATAAAATEATAFIHTTGRYGMLLLPSRFCTRPSNPFCGPSIARRPAVQNLGNIFP